MHALFLTTPPDHRSGKMGESLGDVMREKERAKRRKKREIEQEKRDKDRKTQIEKYNKTTIRIALASIIIAGISLVVAIVGSFIK